MEQDRSSNSSAKLKLKGIFARPIAKESDKIARQILLLAAHVKIAQHELQDGLKRKFQPREDPTKINSSLLKILERTVQVSRGADRLLESVVKKIKKGRGVLRFPLLYFEGGRRFLRRFPGGQTTVALCESFGKLLSTSKIAVKDVVKDSATAVSALVDHRCGEEAAEATYNILAILGHSMHILWKSLEILDPINLPLMEMEIELLDEICECEDNGLEDVQEIIDQAKIENSPETLEQIKKGVELVELAAIEKKESPSTLRK